MRRGQALVELAVILPFVLFLILASIDCGMLLIAKAEQDRRTSVLAEWAAMHPGESWNAVANQELKGCEVAVNEVAHDLLQAASRCRYRPLTIGTWADLPISSRAIAARSHDNGPAASPSSS